MAAFCEVWLLLKYAILILSCLIFLYLTFFSKTKRFKWVFGILSFIAAIGFFLFTANQKRLKRISDLSNVGTYDLIKYPNYNSCKLILNEDYTFEVTNGKSILEKGDWNYDVGCDFWIVYLNKERDQLGSGIYEYGSYKLRNTQNSD